MYTVALFGAGKIGEAITGLLTLSGRYKVKVCDVGLPRAKEIASQSKQSSAYKLNLSSKKETLKILSGCDAVISALPFHCNLQVAKYAAEAQVAYFDLTEDVATTDAIEQLAKNSSSAFMPQCGLAPGFISIAAHYLTQAFDSIDTLKMRVGALPIYPSNRLQYNLTWSTEGLINEYIEMCEVIENGKKQLVFPLEGYETFSLDGNEYEAFNTSGGLGSLADTLLGKVTNLNYKSIRYPGHCDLMAFLLQDLRFNNDRETLRQIFERSISFTPQDKVIILVEVIGTIAGRLTQRTYASTVYNTMIKGKHFGAIQITTASGICTAVDLYLTKKIKQRKGFLRCEEIPLLDFLKNDFGKYYKDEKALLGLEN